MATTTLDGVRLAWHEDGAVATLTVERDPDGTCAHPATLRFSADEGRLRVGLVLLAGRRETDVSIQPALVVRTLGGGGAPGGGAATLTASWVAAFARLHGGWRPASPEAAGLLATVAGGSFPLLGAALDEGAAPLGEVPRWAAPVLAHSSARAGAVEAFGGRATRPVVAALAASLVSGLGEGRADPGGRPVDADGPVTVALHPLVLGLMAPALAPDRLVRVLRAADPWRPADEWPDVDAVARARRLTPDLGEHRTERLLLDAARLDDGPAVLAETLATYDLVRHRLGRRLPNRLQELRAHCTALLPPDPNPHGLVTPRRRARRRPEPARRATAAAPPAPPPPPVPTADERRRAMFHPPATSNAVVPEHVPLDHPPAVAGLADREVPGDTRGRLRFVVPRTAAELRQWGDRLHNCVGGFAPAVNEGRARVIGVESSERLAYCIDVRPDGAIRQFLAAHNRPVPRHDALAVVHALAAAGVVRRELPANSHWFEPERT